MDNTPCARPIPSNFAVSARFGLSLPRTLDLFLDNIRGRVEARPVRNRVVRSRAY
jgi:hypothetical protein